MGAPGDVRHAPATPDDRERYLRQRPKVKEPAE
jgi:hypothetical protein